MGIPGEFGFLKKNELFVGRVAMLGFAAELGWRGVLGRKTVLLCTPSYAGSIFCVMFLGIHLKCCYIICSDAVLESWWSNVCMREPMHIC